jgi:hypothetical protein
LALILQGIEIKIKKDRSPIEPFWNNNCVQFLYTLQKKIRSNPLKEDG